MWDPRGFSYLGVPSASAEVVEGAGAGTGAAAVSEVVMTTEAGWTVRLFALDVSTRSISSKSNGVFEAAGTEPGPR